MRLIFVPLWLARVAHDYRLPHSIFLNKEGLSRYVSKSDLDAYVTSRYSFQDYIRAHLNIDLDVTNPFYGQDQGTSTQIEMIEGMELSTDDNLQRHLLGCACPQESVIRFTAKVITGEDGDQVIAVYATIDGDTKHVAANSKRFLGDLCELLYGYNRSLKDLIKQGLLGNFLKRLG